MTLSEIFRQAAWLVENGEEEFSCNAVFAATPENSRHAVIIYRYLLSPRDNGTLEIADFAPWVNANNEQLQAAQDHRVLALCMAATLARKGGA